jgi:hypothetical protein
MHDTQRGQSVLLRAPKTLCFWNARVTSRLLNIRSGGHGNSLLLEHRASENRPAPQGGVEAVERHRGHEQNAGQTDARIPGGRLGRQGKVLQNIEDQEIND